MNKCHPTNSVMSAEEPSQHDDPEVIGLINTGVDEGENQHRQRQVIILA